MLVWEYKNNKVFQNTVISCSEKWHPNILKFDLCQVSDSSNTIDFATFMFFMNIK